jgi:Tfp pilus assembly protein PilN
VQELGEQVKKDEALLKNLGWEGGINKSGLIDQVAALLPEEVKTTEISINSVDLNASRSQKILVFYQRRITIVGTSEKIIPVNEWIARIKTRPWVKTVRMESYTYDTELNTGKFLVTIDY